MTETLPRHDDPVTRTRGGSRSEHEAWRSGGRIETAPTPRGDGMGRSTSGRAPKGSGTVVKRSDGRYHAAVHVLTASGGRKRVYVYGATWGEADRKRRALPENNRLSVPSTWSDTPLEEYLRYWFDDVAGRVSASSTVSRKRALARDHIIPHLGAVSLGRLSVGDVRRLLGTLRKTRGRHGMLLSLRTRQSVHLVLRCALQDAQREGLIGDNVATLVPSPTT